MSLEIAVKLSQIVLVLAALGTLIWEVHSSRVDRKWDQFIELVNFYEDVALDSKDKWEKIKESIQKTPETKHEITNKTNGIEYLARLCQPLCVNSSVPS